MPKVLRVKDPHDSYHVKKELFDLPMSMIVVGKSQLSGKSNFLTWLLCSTGANYLNNFLGENIYIVSPSFSNDNKLKIIKRQFDIPDSNIIHQFDDQLVEGIYDEVEEQYEEHEAEKLKPPHSLIIFDDCSFSPEFKKSKIVKRCYQNGRHILLSTIVTAQVYTNVSCSARENSKALILFDSSDRQIERMAFDHGTVPMKQFKKMFRHTASQVKHSFLCINYSNPNTHRFLNTDFERIDMNDFK